MNKNSTVKTIEIRSGSGRKGRLINKHENKQLSTLINIVHYAHGKMLIKFPIVVGSQPRPKHHS